MRVTARCSVRMTGRRELEALIRGRLTISEEMGRQIAEVLRADVARQFAVGGDPRWKPLAESTIRAKFRYLGYPRLNRFGGRPEGLTQRNAFGPQNILMRTGALFSSWTNDLDGDHIERIDSEGVSIGSSIRYAIYHQRGARRLPRRPLLVTDQARGAITELIMGGHR